MGEKIILVYDALVSLILHERGTTNQLEYELFDGVFLVFFYVFKILQTAFNQ